MSADATTADIAAEVTGMGLSRGNALATRTALRFLRRRAYGRAELAALAERSAFGGAEVTSEGITLTATLTRR